MSSGRFIAGVVIGACAGVALGLAYAPTAGQETRSRVAEAVERLRERLAARSRAAELRVKGAALEQMGEMMKEAGRSEQELAERQAAEGG